MEANGEQNEDLQIQNLSDDEELYHSGVDYSNKAEETKPVTIKSNSQSSLQNLTETDIPTITNVDETQENCLSDDVINKNSTDKNLTESENKDKNETITDNEQNSNGKSETEEMKDKSNQDNKVTTNEQQNKDNDDKIKDTTENEKVIKNNADIKENPNNDNNEYDCTYSFKVDKNNKKSGDRKNVNFSNRPSTAVTPKNTRPSTARPNTTMNCKSPNRPMNRPSTATEGKSINNTTSKKTGTAMDGKNTNNTVTKRPSTAITGGHVRYGSTPNKDEKKVKHTRFNTAPSESKNMKHNIFNSNDKNGSKGSKNYKDKNLQKGESDYDKELKKREELSAKNAKKNAEICKDENTQRELEEIEAEKRRVIAGDISIHSSEDEKEPDIDEDQKTEATTYTHPPSTSNSSTKTGKDNKSTKKKGTANKKNSKNNYRSFISIKPTCNRYMANMWNNYCYSIHKMNILNIKKTVDNDAPKKYIHIDQKLKTRQMKKEREAEIRRDNQNILNRMIYQGRNNVGTSNLDNNNDVIEPVFRSLHAEQNKRLEIEKNRESLTLLKRLKEKKPYCSVEQWKKERLITEVYLRNISTYPENYPIRQKSQQKHVPPIKKNENEELKREKSPLEQTEIIYGGGKQKLNRNKRCPTSNTTASTSTKKSNKSSNKGNNNDKRRSNASTANKDDNANTRPRKPKHRTLSESTRQSVKLYADTSINQNQADRLYLEQKNNGKYKVPENNTSTAFDRVLNNYEKIEGELKDDINTIKSAENNIDNIKDITNDINEVSNEISTQLEENENKPPIEEIPITEIENK